MATVTAAVAASLFSPTTPPPTLLRVRSRRGTPQVRSTRISDSVNGVKVVEDGSQISSETQDPPVLYDDGFGKIGVMDYIDRSKEIERFSGDGSPRWFCPLECGRPIKGAPLLLFLPGLDGSGMGLILHHNSLGKFFEVRCLHIPITNRTPFLGLVRFVEKTLRYQHARFPNKPVYLVGDSLGGCLALSIAARNPAMDLVLILANPATSFGKSQLQPFFPILDVIPNNLDVTVPYMLSFVMGEPLKLAMASISNGLSPADTLSQLSETLTSLLLRLSDLTDLLPKESINWKINLVRAAALYTNSRLHAVNAQVMLLTSGKDNMLPSKEEGARLKASLKNCRVRHFKDNGHTLLLEDGINLMTIVKAMNLYRRSKQHNFITDYAAPSLNEFKKVFEYENKLLSQATGPVIFSTLSNGDIVRNLSGIPDEGPILLVGYHMLMGLELQPLYERFFREKNVCIRGMAHPSLFQGLNETSDQELSFPDFLKLFGSLPVSPRHMYKLFSQKAVVLLYPGGAREALHRKGEEYKLFWPDSPEFVRMAAQFDVKIVPFGVVGEDDIGQLVLDYNDQSNIPIIKDLIKNLNKNVTSLRSDMTGAISEQDFHLPIILPRIPGRFYYLFGKSIETKGMKKMLKDRNNVNTLYMKIKSEVENSISYLKKKREEDPYRSILDRSIFQASTGSELADIPTFEP